MFNNNINLDVRDKIDNGTLAKNGTSSDKDVTNELHSLRFSTLTEVFPCFFLSCKANARV